MKNSKKPLYLLDGYSLIYRTYFAFMRSPLTNSRGDNVSVVFGFFRSLFSLFDQYKPERFAVVLDSPTPTFRHKMYPEYKANREKAPDDLHSQVPVVREILDALGISILVKEGYEADDIIATYARRCSDEERRCFIITGDKDLFQLVDSSVSILKPDKGSYSRYLPDDVKRQWDVDPKQILDYLSLTGDSSDNVPGVQGIGPKTAAKLLNEYADLDAIYENVDSVKGAAGKKLAAGKDSAYLSKKLITLEYNVPLDQSVDDLSCEEPDFKAAIPIFAREEVNSLVEQLGGSADDIQPAGNDHTPEGESGSSDFGKKGEYESVTTEEELDKWIKKITKAGLCAFDIETDSVDEMKAVPVGFSFSLEPLSGCYIPLRAGGEDVLPEDAVRTRLKKLFAGDVKVIGHNFKYDYKVLRRWGVSVPPWFDTMVAAWLCDSIQSMYGMDALALRLFGYKTIHFDEVVAKGETFDSVSIDKATEYAAEDADITFRLYHYYKKELDNLGLTDLFHKTEMPLSVILAEMELGGIPIDRSVLDSFGEELAEELESIKKKIYDLCGKEFNINSTKQLQQVLFEERKLTPVKKTKTGYSTDTSVLETLAKEDPVPELVLRHRTMTKLKSTYVDALPKMINEDTGRIHTRLVQTGTATGRLSSRDPNLQNIPIKDEEGRRIRKAFIPDKGCVFLSADYSQIELVLLAHLSGDKQLSTAFKEGEDVHTKTASLLFDSFPEMISPEQRRIAKTINFGVMYGMSAFRLSNELSIPRKKAANFIDSYFERYSGIRKFIDKTVEQAEKDGYVTTLDGHRRTIPGITSRNKTEKMGAERVAVNTPIQGSAADIVKRAMLKLSKRVGEEIPGAEMMLQIHDELLFQVEKDKADKLEKIVKEEMENAVTLSVPLRVSIETGDSWGDLH